MRAPDKLKAVVPVGSVTDELDVFKVLLSRGFGFSLWGCCWNCGSSSLKPTQQQLEMFQPTNTNCAQCVKNTSIFMKD